jgi:hypothetical protein
VVPPGDPRLGAAVTVTSRFSLAYLVRQRLRPELGLAKRVTVINDDQDDDGSFAGGLFAEVDGPAARSGAVIPGA